jgi:hypothetical protein
MKNLFIHYAKQLLLIVFIICTPNLLFAQNKPMKYPGNKTEQKEGKSSFIFYEQRDSYFMFNKNNSLMVYESSFEIRTSHSQGSYDMYVKFYERQKIDDLVYKIIAPYFRDYKSKYADDVSTFEIVLYSKPDGKIRELSFSYNKDAKIPLNAIEKLEKEILALELNFKFDELAYEPLIKNALWVHYPLMFSVSRMKKYLKEKSN